VIVDGDAITHRKPPQLVTRAEARTVELQDESA
jgi:hypothetical protein